MGKTLIYFTIQTRNVQSLDIYQTALLYSELHRLQIEMKYFEQLKLQLHWLGILQWQPDNKAKRIAIITTLLVLYISYVLTTVCYLAFQAQTPTEYSESLVIVLSTFLIILWYLTLLFQSKKYATFLDQLNLIIEKSKLNGHNHEEIFIFFPSPIL